MKNKILLRGQEIANDMGILVFAASGSDWFSGVAWMTTLVRGSQLRVERWSFQWLNELGRWVLVPITTPKFKSVPSNHLTWWLPAPLAPTSDPTSVSDTVTAGLKQLQTTQPLKAVAEQLCFRGIFSWRYFRIITHQPPLFRRIKPNIPPKPSIFCFHMQRQDQTLKHPLQLVVVTHHGTPQNSSESKGPTPPMPPGNKALFLDNHL